MRDQQFCSKLRELGMDILMIRKGIQRNIKGYTIDIATVIVGVQSVRVQVEMYKDPNTAFKFWNVQAIYAPIEKEPRQTQTVMKVNTLCQHACFHDEDPEKAILALVNHLLEREPEVEKEDQISAVHQNDKVDSQKEGVFAEKAASVLPEFGTFSEESPIRTLPKDHSPDKTVEAQFSYI